HGRGNERTAARDGGDTPLRPVQPRPSHLRRTQARRHRTPVRQALVPTPMRASASALIYVAAKLSAGGRGGGRGRDGGVRWGRAASRACLCLALSFPARPFPFPRPAKSVLHTTANCCTMPASHPQGRSNRGTMAATTINVDAYVNALIVLAIAGIVVPMGARWRVSPVLGYLAAGALLGPYGLGSLQTAAPFLYWVTITDAHRLAGIAELGVVFLTFVIGLELSFQRLLTMRRLVFGLGGLQVVLTAAVIAGIAALFGTGGAASLIVGLSLALSSTAIVLELLSRQGRLMTSTGRTCF